MGVLQLPSSAVRKARSQTTASLVSSWFSVARYRAALSSPSLQAMPIAPCSASMRETLNSFVDHHENTYQHYARRMFLYTNHILLGGCHCAVYPLMPACRVPVASKAGLHGQ